MYGIKDFVTPVAGKYRITSGEGHRRSGRTTNGKSMSSFHHGMDWAGAAPGSKPDIRNVTAGKVVWTGKAGGWGNAVIVKNPDGFIVQYGHLDSVAVKPGDQVSAGQKIGVMGATGNVTGVHLDMIVVKDGKTLKRDGSVLAPAHASVLRRAGGKVASTPTTQTSASPQAQAPVASTAGASIQQASDYTQSLQQAQDSAGQGTQAHQTQQVQQPQMQDVDLFGGSGGGLNILNGSVGLAVPQTAKENKMFGAIANMGLDSSLEQIYAEAARAISKASDGVIAKPMLQSDNPLRAELGAIFDRLDV